MRSRISPDIKADPHTLVENNRMRDTSPTTFDRIWHAYIAPHIFHYHVTFYIIHTNALVA